MNLNYYTVYGFFVCLIPVIYFVLKGNFTDTLNTLRPTLRSYNFQAIWRVFGPSSENLLNLNNFLETAEVN